MEEAAVRQKEAASGPMQQAAGLQRASVRKQPTLTSIPPWPRHEVTKAPAYAPDRIPSLASIVPSTISGDGFFTQPWPLPEFFRLSGRAARPCLPIPEPTLQVLIDISARSQELSPFLIREVIRQESRSYPCAESAARAQGLMQLMPATQEHFGVSNPFDAAQNIAAGSRYLRQLLERYGGDTALALSAYNAGPARVDRARGIPPIAETKNYVRAVSARLPELAEGATAVRLPP